MVEREGSLLDNCMLAADNFVIIPTHNIKRISTGNLIVSAGFSLAVQKKFGGDFARRMGRSFLNGRDYFFLLFIAQRIGVLQIKNNLKSMPNMDLLKTSLELFRHNAIVYRSIQFNIPRPGCHNGGLDWGIVRPLCRTLPDNVHIWSHY